MVYYETFGDRVEERGMKQENARFFLHFSEKEKLENTKIYTKIYHLVATGHKASGQCLFTACGDGTVCGSVNPSTGGALACFQLHGSLFEAKASHILDICTLAKCFTMGPKRCAHSANAWSTCTYAAARLGVNT